MSYRYITNKITENTKKYSIQVSKRQKTQTKSFNFEVCMVHVTSNVLGKHYLIWPKKHVKSISHLLNYTTWSYVKITKKKYKIILLTLILNLVKNRPRVDTNTSPNLRFKTSKIYHIFWLVTFTCLGYDPRKNLFSLVICLITLILLSKDIILPARRRRRRRKRRAAHFPTTTNARGRQGKGWKKIVNGHRGAVYYSHAYTDTAAACYFDWPRLS